MARSIHLYTRNTSRLGNNSKFIGTIKVVHSKSFHQDGLDGRVTRVHSARLPVALRDLSTTQLYNYLADEYEQRCSCEHDCCGCYFGGVREVHKQGRRISIISTYMRNL